MDISKLTRNAELVHTYLKETPDGRLITTKECKIYIPQRYDAIGLASIGVETHIVGLFAMVFDDKDYGVMCVNSMMRSQPTKTEKVKIGHTDYYELTIPAGGTVVADLNLVQRDLLVYYIYNEVISAGKIPWYLTYEDLGSIFDTAKEYANANIGSNREITEMIISQIARNSEDRSIFYRTTAAEPEQLKKKKPSYIPLRSVIFAATNTTNKLAGSYMQVGVVSALVTPSTEVERMESLLRR